jgi:hypothetical protein
METPAQITSPELTDDQLLAAQKIVALRSEFRTGTHAFQVSRNPFDRLFGRIAGHYDDRGAEALLTENGVPGSLQEAEARFARG